MQSPDFESVEYERNLKQIENVYQIENEICWNICYFIGCKQTATIRSTAALQRTSFVYFSILYVPSIRSAARPQLCFDLQSPP